jgi:hypothetical protein
MVRNGSLHHRKENTEGRKWGKKGRHMRRKKS